MSLAGAYRLIELLNQLEDEGISVDTVPDLSGIKVQYEDDEPTFLEPRFDAASDLYLWAVSA